MTIWDRLEQIAMLGIIGGVLVAIYDTAHIALIVLRVAT